MPGDSASAAMLGQDLAPGVAAIARAFAASEHLFAHIIPLEWVML